MILKKEGGHLLRHGWYLLKIQGVEMTLGHSLITLFCIILIDEKLRFSFCRKSSFETSTNNQLKTKTEQN